MLVLRKRWHVLPFKMLQASAAFHSVTVPQLSASYSLLTQENGFKQALAESDVLMRPTGPPLGSINGLCARSKTDWLRCSLHARC